MHEVHLDAWSREDYAAVHKAVQQRGAALAEASPELRASREIVLAAVASGGEALKHAAVDLRSDAEVRSAVCSPSKKLYQGSVRKPNRIGQKRPRRRRLQLRCTVTAPTP